MSWNPHTDPLPTEAELAEPDKRLEELIRYIRQQDDPVALAAWFLEHMASTFRLPLTVGALDPVHNWTKLSQATVWALHAAGQERRGLRPDLVDAVGAHTEELVAQIRFWREEAKERSLQQKWGDPVAPTSQRTGRG